MTRQLCLDKVNKTSRKACCGPVAPNILIRTSYSRGQNLFCSVTGADDTERRDVEKGKKMKCLEV